MEEKASRTSMVNCPGRAPGPETHARKRDARSVSRCDLPVPTCFFIEPMIPITSRFTAHSRHLITVSHVFLCLFLTPERCVIAFHSPV